MSIRLLRLSPTAAAGVRRSSCPNLCRYSSTHAVPPTVIDELKRRGFVAALTSEDFNASTRKPTSVYLGVDPSAPSLHAGNLLALLGLLHFQIRGHQAILLVGGATGSIGDPSGRSSERTFLDSAALDFNVQSITAQVNTLFSRGRAYADKRITASPKGFGPVGEVQDVKVLNNLEWFQSMSLLDFLRGAGKTAKVSSMLARDSVKNRLSSESGISFTEFSYQLLQAQDFLHLHREYGCNAQIGGSDQWGNIISGTELISRHYSALAEEKTADKKGKEKEKALAWLEKQREGVFGLTIPLLTTANGEKFGKSVGNPIWLDERRTSVFDFYQFFIRTTDADVDRYLRLFTLLPVDRIESVMEAHNLDPSARAAQKLLASEVTELVHGPDGLARALTGTTVLYESDLSSLKTVDVLNAFENDSRLARIPSNSLPASLAKLAADYKTVPSRTAATKIMSGGGFYVNGAKATDPKATLDVNQLIDGRLAILRVGKTGNLVVCVDPPVEDA